MLTSMLNLFGRYFSRNKSFSFKTKFWVASFPCLLGFELKSFGFNIHGVLIASKFFFFINESISRLFTGGWNVPDRLLLLPSLLVLTNDCWLPESKRLALLFFFFKRDVLPEMSDLLSMTDTDSPMAGSLLKLVNI